MEERKQPCAELGKPGTSFFWNNGADRLLRIRDTSGPKTDIFFKEKGCSHTFIFIEVKYWKVLIMQISQNTIWVNCHQMVELKGKNPRTLQNLRAGSQKAWVMIFTQSWIHILLNSTGILNSWSWQLLQFWASLTYLQVLCFLSCLCSGLKHFQILWRRLPPQFRGNYDVFQGS